MPRPRKCRRVCAMPQNSRLGPVNGGCSEEIAMTVDEYEALRLIDLAGYTQEECAAQMGVARTTVQGVYNDARRKVAESLVTGKVLVIAGGEYDLCDGAARSCGKKCHPICCKKEKITQPTNTKEMSKHE